MEAGLNHSCDRCMQIRFEVCDCYRCRTSREFQHYSSIRFADEHSDYFYLRRDQKALKASAERGCYLCTLLLSGLLYNGSNFQNPGERTWESFVGSPRSISLVYVVDRTVVDGVAVL